MGKHNEVDITPHNFFQKLLEDPLLTDYYNAFLVLPAFAQRLYFDKKFAVLCKPDHMLSRRRKERPRQNSTLPYDYKQVGRRDAVFNWNVIERLPYFLRTRLYQEYKLCKLLTRKIDSRRGTSAVYSRDASRIGGYSISQSTGSPYAKSNTSLTRIGSAPSKASRFIARNELINRENGTVRRPQSSVEPRTIGESDSISVSLSDIPNLPVYKRPKSGAYSLPPMLSKSYSSREIQQEGSTSTRSNRITSSLNEVHSTDSTTEDNSLSEVKSTGRSISNTDKEDAYAKRMLPVSSGIKTVSGLTSADTGFGTMAENSPSKTRRSQLTTRGGLTTAYDSAANIAEEDEQLGHGDFEDIYGNLEDDLTTINMTDDYGGIFADIESSDDDNDYEDDNKSSVIDFSKGEEDSFQDTQRTQADAKSLAEKWKINLYELKVRVLNSLSGMKIFKEFLIGTSGENLLQFWVDVEYYKEKVMKQLHDTKELRIKLVREIEDKYKDKLTDDAKAQIGKAKRDEGLSHTLFVNAQYDILRRLRSYWCNRFLLHIEKSPNFRNKLNENSNSSSIQEMDEILKQRAYRNMKFLPTLNLQYETQNQIDCSSSSQDNTKFDIAKSNSMIFRKREKSAHFTSDFLISNETFITGLSSDVLAGDPFISYLERQKLPKVISMCSFWKEVSAMEAAEEHSANRRLQLSIAWSIWKRFVSKESSYDVDATIEEEKQIRHYLRQEHKKLYCATFSKLKIRIEEILKTHWKNFYEDDIRSFNEVEYGSHDNVHTPLHTPSNKSISFKDVVTIYPRPWDVTYPESTASERGVRLQRALTLADDNYGSYIKTRSGKNRRWASYSKRKTIGGKSSQSERTTSSSSDRRMSRSAQQRALNIIKEGIKAQVITKEKQDDEKSLESHRSITRPISFMSFTEDKTTMDSFKSYVQRNTDESLYNMLLMYLDIETYKRITQVKKSQRKTQAYHILRVYVNKDARRNVTLPDKLYNSIKKDPSMPPTEDNLIAIQEFTKPKLESLFKKFVKVHFAEQYKSIRVDVDEEAAKEPDKRPGSTTRSIVLSWKNRRKGRGRTPGRMQPLKADKDSFTRALHECAAGKLSTEMEYFKRYLSQCGEEDGFPFLVNDLYFWLEIEKYKEIALDYSDESVLKSKAAVIVECYLYSQAPPPVQVDVTPEIAYRIVQSFKYSRNFTKDMRDGTVFDDAQVCVFRELLMYWAGFQQQYIPPQPGENQFKIPWYSKQQKVLMQRFEEFQRHIPVPLPLESHIPIALDGFENVHLCFSLSRGVRWKTEKELLEEEIIQNQGPNQRHRPGAPAISTSPSLPGSDASY